MYDINCIRLDVEGDHPLPVHARIREQIEKCVKECMGSLRFISALRFGTASETEDEFVLVNLEAVREVQASNGNLVIVQGYPSLNRQSIASNYSSWLINAEILPSYDVFISHRWHKDDDVVIDLLYDSLLGYTVGLENKAVTVFLDKVRLKEGEQFQGAFGKALINSTIFVPMLCTSALQRMIYHNPTVEDNVLIEWMLALECMSDQTHSKIRGIYPLMFGEKRGDGSVTDLFAMGVIDRLPKSIIPAASITVVRKLLTDNGMNESSFLSSCTVHQVVSEISKYLGMQGWEEESPESIVRKASSKIMSYLEK